MKGTLGNSGALCEKNSETPEHEKNSGNSGALSLWERISAISDNVFRKLPHREVEAEPPEEKISACASITSE